MLSDVLSARPAEDKTSPERCTAKFLHVFLTNVDTIRSRSAYSCTDLFTVDYVI